jgi:hypothetical protein
MEVSFIWNGIPPAHTAIIAFFAGFFVFSRFWAKNKSRPRKERMEAKATGYFFLIWAVWVFIVDITSGLTIANPSRYFLVGTAIIALSLVYIDGWLTERAVGNPSAIEANPIMGGLFKIIGIRKTRIGIFVLMSALIAYLVVSWDLVGVGLLGVLWVFIDGNNIIVLRGIRRTQALRASVTRLEWGFEDLHEF